MENSGNIIFVFLMYSTAMLILPIFTFFAVKNLLEKEFHVTGFPNTAWSVMCAVIVVNLIIMAYAWRAYKQEKIEDQMPKNMQPVVNKESPNDKKKE